METKIYELLSEIRPEFDFDDSEDFIEDGYLDSFDLTTLITELEEIFGCIIDPMEVRADNFVSVKAIISLVEKSRQ